MCDSSGLLSPSLLQIWVGSWSWKSGPWDVSSNLGAGRTLPMWSLVNDNFFHPFIFSNPLVIFDLLHSWSKFISHLSMQLEHIQTAKETMWAQKARTWWLKGGDKNTKFYHHSPNRRRSKNFIPFLEVNRVELSNQDAISNAFSNFFCNLMGTTAPSHDIDVNWEQYYPVTSRPHLLDLEEPFMEEEIRATMFSLGADKAPVQMALILDSISTFGRFFDKTSSTSFRLYMMEISILPNWTELT